MEPAIALEIEQPSQPPRQFPIGAEVKKGAVHFRVWAPNCQSVSIVIDCGAALAREKRAGPHALVPEDQGYSVAVRTGRAKSLSQFRTLGTAEIQERLPDPWRSR